MMKNLFKYIVLFVCLLAIYMFAGCSNSKEIRIVNMDEGVLYASYDTFQDAFDRADIVIFGKIKTIGQSHLASFNENICHTPVTIEKINMIKGSHSIKEITYKMRGGNIDNTVYKVEAYPTENIKVGDCLIVFLKKDTRDNEYYVISPNMFFLADKDGAVEMDLNMIPEDYQIYRFEKTSVDIITLQNILVAESKIWIRNNEK